MKVTPVISRPSANTESSPANGLPQIGPTVHRAGWVVADPWHIYENGYVYVDADEIKAVGTGSAPCCGAVIDHGPGALMPALANAHTHLELGALKGAVSYAGGFRKWVAALLRKRADITESEILAGIERGCDELVQSGCALIGEVSTLGASRQILRERNVSGVWFREFLGNDTPGDLACTDSSGRMRGALAGHAPHSTAPDLLKVLKQTTRDKHLPMSIHVSESDDEIRFITTARGEWADFLHERGIDFAAWGLPAPTPVSHLDRLGILDNLTLAVHLLHARRKEFELLARRRVSVCVCPRSNWNLHGRLPDLAGMLRAGLAPCIGTDSLASVSSLSIWDEIKFMATSYPNISVRDILGMATQSGARALGFGGRFGSLAPGFLPAMVYVPVESGHESMLVERIVNGDWQ